MTNEDEIELALLANVTNEWRKVAFVIGTTMMKIEGEQRVGRDDSYFLQRIVSLVEKGLIEHAGDLSQMRECEIRLSRVNGS